MGFKSIAQQKKLKELSDAGKFSKTTFDKWSKETDLSKLQERTFTKAKAAKTKAAAYVSSFNSETKLHSDNSTN